MATRIPGRMAAKPSREERGGAPPRVRNFGHQKTEDTSRLHKLNPVATRLVQDRYRLDPVKQESKIHRVLDPSFSQLLKNLLLNTLNSIAKPVVLSRCGDVCTSRRESSANRSISSPVRSTEKNIAISGANVRTLLVSERRWTHACDHILIERIRPRINECVPDWLECPVVVRPKAYCIEYVGRHMAH